MATLCPSCATRNLEGADECDHCGAALIHTGLNKTEREGYGRFMRQPLTALGLSPPNTITAGETLETAVRLLVERQLNLLAVVEDGRLIGVLSVRDIMVRVGPQYREKLALPVRAFMTPSPVGLPPDAPIPFALNQMDVGGYRHVPVVEEDRLLGLVDARDLLRHFFDAHA